VLLVRFVSPPGLDRLVFRAKNVFVDVAVLDDERRDPLGMRGGVPETDLRSVVVKPDA
jgi:hypothetical protein